MGVLIIVAAAEGSHRSSRFTHGAYYFVIGPIGDMEMHLVPSIILLLSRTSPSSSSSVRPVLLRCVFPFFFSKFRSGSLCLLPSLRFYFSFTKIRMRETV